MEHVFIKKVLLICIVFVLIAVLILDMFYFSLRRLDIKADTLESSLIPKEFNDVSIVFFSDLHYSASMNNTILPHLIEEINALNPDLVFFGGDLLAENTGSKITDENKAFLIEQLSGIKAPLGKYAVYGNHDREDDDAYNVVTQVLSSASFTLLNNQNVQIKNKSDSYIQLVGLDNEYNGTLDMETAFSGITDTAYTILLEHTPDTLDKVTNYPIQLMLSGHSHGGQVRLPWIGSIVKTKYGKKYVYGTYYSNTIRLDVNSGIGTTALPIRLLANPTINYYVLKHIE